MASFSNVVNGSGKKSVWEALGSGADKALTKALNITIPEGGTKDQANFNDSQLQDQANLGNPNGQNTTSNPYGGGWGYGGYGYGGYGGGGGGSAAYSGPSDLAKEQAKNLQPIANYNYETLGNKYNLGDKAFDTADKQSGNLQAYQVANAVNIATADWYRQQQKLQSAMKNMRDVMGKAAYGSDYLNMYEDFARADDQMDDDTLKTMKENMANIDTNYYEAIMDNVNSRNKLAADTETGMRELVADTASQMANIDPMIANGDYQAGYTGVGDNREKGDAPDDADEYFAYINRDKGTLNVPDNWTGAKNFANKNWQNAITPEQRGMLRDDLSAQKTSATGNRNRYASIASAATRKTQGLRSYLAGYGNRRTQ